MEGGFRQLAVARAWIIDSLFPRFCLRCRAEGELFCESCAGAYAPGPMPDGVRTEALDGVASLGWYRDPVLRGAIWQAKYIGDERVWDVIERWIRGSAVEARLPLRPWVVAHVPLHAARCRERGYDQAKRIADILARHLGLPEEDMLTRKSWTDPQARTGSHDRALGDLEGAFRAVGQPPQFVLLCDDVFTSGATMDAAARTLKDAGAEVVWGFVLGRG